MRPLSHSSPQFPWEDDPDHVRVFVRRQDQAFQAAMRRALYQDTPEPETVPEDGADAGDRPQSEPLAPIPVFGRLRITAPPMPIHDSIAVIIERVSEMSGIPVVDITGPSRFREHVDARHYAIWLAYTRGRWSLPQIGRAFGGRDHTTVLNGVRRIQRLHDAGRLHEIMKGWEG